MERKAMCSNKQNSEARVERDLWSSLLHAEGAECGWDGLAPLSEEQFTVAEDANATIAYPWNPADPNTEDFFAQLEQGFSLDDWDSEEVATRSTHFFNQVDQLWSANTLQASLLERFAARMPQQFLGAIAQRAQQAIVTSQSLANQLVQCVEDVLPHLAQDDLFVLARPLAHAMRNGESKNAVDAALAKVRPIAWEELSEIEQARLSLAIARCALSELEKGH